MSDLTLRELATRLDAHLKRLAREGVLDLANPGAYYMGGARIRLTYRSREGGTTLTRDKAARYLAWLEAGHVGRHTAWMRASGVSTAVLDGRD